MVSTQHRALVLLPSPKGFLGRWAQSQRQPVDHLPREMKIPAEGVNMQGCGGVCVHRGVCAGVCVCVSACICVQECVCA